MVKILCQWWIGIYVAATIAVNVIVMSILGFKVVKGITKHGNEVTPITQKRGDSPEV